MLYQVPSGSKSFGSGFATGFARWYAPRSAIGVDVPLRLVFEHPTLAALAAAADRLAAGGNQAGAGSEEAGDHPAAADGATAPAPASPLSVADLLAHLEQPNARTTG